MYRSRLTFSVNRLHRVCAVASLAMALAAVTSLPVRAQEPYQFESDLMAKRRLYRDVGAGFRQIRRGPNGNYYVLTAPAAAVLWYAIEARRPSRFILRAERWPPQSQFPCRFPSCFFRGMNSQ